MARCLQVRRRSRGVALDRHRARPARRPPSADRSTSVEDDRRQPAAQAELADPFGVVRNKRPVGTHQRVLGGLLGIPGVAEHAQRDRVEAVLVGDHESVERGVEVVGKGGRQAIVSVHHRPEPSLARNRCTLPRYAPSPGPGGGPRATIADMGHEDRFDDLIASLGGFHRTWLIYLGIELGLFGRIRESGEAGITPAELASVTGTASEAVAAWSWATDAHDLTRFDDGRLTSTRTSRRSSSTTSAPSSSAASSSTRSTASMDWGGMEDFFRTGQPIASRPDPLPDGDRAADQAGHRGVLPGGAGRDAAARGRPVSGGRAVDVHCGGGRWLVAMAAASRPSSWSVSNSRRTRPPGRGPRSRPRG